MEQYLPRNIEAALLFDSYSAFHPKELLSLLNQVVAEFDLKFRWVPREDADGTVQFVCDECGVTIDHSPVPKDASAFQFALSSGYTDLDFPNARAAVESHKSYVSIRVGRGLHIAENDTGNGMAGETGTQLDREEFDFVVMLLKSMAMVYMSRSRPLAIYWQQCDKLMSVRQFAELALEQRDISLLIHPEIITQHDDATQGETWTGFQTKGVDCLLGKEIRFEPSKVDISRLLERMIQFILKTTETGLMIPNGDTFGVDENEAIRVYHVDREDEGPGLVRLVYERCDDFGLIPEELEEGLTGDFDEVDLENPAERALQDRIDAMKKLENETSLENASESEASDPAADEAWQQPEPWEGVKRRADMSSLRALTRGDETIAVKARKAVLQAQEVASQTERDQAGEAVEPPFSPSPSMDVDLRENVPASVSDGVSSDGDSAPDHAGLLKRFTGILSR